MHQGDKKITKADIEQLHREMCETGLKNPAVKLFESEPELMEVMTDTWERVEAELVQYGLTPEQKRQIHRRMTEHTMKPLILLDRAHRKLWADLLPSDDEGANHAT